MIFISSLVLVLVLISSHTVSAFGLNHMEIMMGVYTQGTPKKDARIAYKSLRKASKALSFLDCPMKLIDMQYNGIESVLIGAQILSSYVENSAMSMSQFEGLMSGCENTLGAYQRDVKAKKVRSRAVSDQEIMGLMGQFNKSMTPAQMAIAGLVMNSVNQDTVCYVQRNAIEIALGIGGSIGNTVAECFTPMGRHFILSGPSLSWLRSRCDRGLYFG